MPACSKKRLAVSAMIELALCEQAGPVTVRALAKRHLVLRSCLEQVFARLRTAGLVESTRGPGGGYTLGRQPEAISVADIVAVVEAGAPGARKRNSRPDTAGDLWRRLRLCWVWHSHGSPVKARALSSP